MPWLLMSGHQLVFYWRYEMCLFCLPWGCHFSVGESCVVKIRSLCLYKVIYNWSCECILLFVVAGVAQGVLTGIRGLCNGLGPALYGFIFYLFHVDLNKGEEVTKHPVTTNNTSYSDILHSLHEVSVCHDLNKIVAQEKHRVYYVCHP